jgi:hypothetical protein
MYTLILRRIVFMSAELKSQKMSMESLFQSLGVDWRSMSPGTWVEIGHKNAKIKSFNLHTQVEEYKKVLRLVRKSDEDYFCVSGGECELLCTLEHRLYASKDGSFFDYYTLQELGSTSFFGLSGTGLIIPLLRSESSTSRGPVLDIEVEDNHNYFSDGVLSSNTNGGQAIKFYASWRGRVSQGAPIMHLGEQIGNVIKIKNQKNKVGVPKRSTEMELTYASGFNPDRAYMDFIVKLGIVDVKGSYYTKPDWGMTTQHGQDQLFNWFIGHRDEFEQAKALVNESFTSYNALDIEDTEADPITEAEAQATAGSGSEE